MIRFYCFLLLFGLVYSSVHGQGSSVADSLEHKLTEGNQDTFSVKTFIDIAWELKQENEAKAKRYLDSALVLSEKLGFLKGKAEAKNYLGVVNAIHGDYEAALENYRSALELRLELGDEKGVAGVYNNLGNIEEDKGNFENAFAYYKKSLRIRQSLGDSSRIARLQYNMGLLQEQMGNYPEALNRVYQYAIYAEKTNDDKGLAYAHNIIGNIQLELVRFDRAYESYDKALTIFKSLDLEWETSSVLNNLGNLKNDRADSLSKKAGAYELAKPIFDTAIILLNEALELRVRLDDEDGMAELYNNLAGVFKDRGSNFDQLKQLSEAKSNWDKALIYFEKSLQIREKLGDKKGIIEAYNGIGDVLRRQKKLKKALSYTTRYLAIAEDINDQKFMQSAYKDLSKVYSDLGDYQQAFEYRKLYDELRYDRLDEKRFKEMTRREALYGDEKKELEIERQQQKNDLLDAQLKQQAVLRNSLIGGAFALLLLALLLFNRNRIKTRANAILAEKNEIIAAEKERSDALLLNILPEKTALELKEKGKTTARHYDAVSVLFSDFASFTSIAEQSTPEELVSELDTCFRAFDSIIDKYGIEKIKTIGDAYMCASGLPESSTDHATNLVHAALEMQEFMQQHKGPFQMRIGIHSGSVVAGVVGSKKFAYDIWGDAVNLAARMEQSGEVGKVNISQSTYNLVKNKFNCVSRGKIAAKNKGEVEMYFVDNYQQNTK